MAKITLHVTPSDAAELAAIVSVIIHARGSLSGVTWRFPLALAARAAITSIGMQPSK